MSAPEFLFIALWTAGLAPVVGDAGGVGDAGPEDALVFAPALQREVVARLEPGQVRLGERFELIVEVARDPGQQVELALPDDLGDLERIAPVTREMRQEGDSIFETFRVPLAAFGLEHVETPALKIRSSTGETIEVPPLPVRVVTSLDPNAPPEGLAEAVGPVTVERFDPRPVVLAAVALCFALLLLALRVVFRRRVVSPAAVRRATPEPPPDAVALERLRALERSSLVADGRLDLFVDEATDILRWYLGRRYRIRALDRTTRELREALGVVLDARLEVGVVEQLLTDADLIKFARAPTSSRACAQLIDEVRGVVMATREARRRASQEAA